MGPRHRTKISTTTLLFGFCLAIIVGLILAQWVEINASLRIIIGLFGFYLLSRNLVGTFLILWLIGLLIGNWRGVSYNQKLTEYSNLYGKQVVFQAKATTDATYSKRGQLQFDIQNPQFSEPENLILPGKIRVEGFNLTTVYRGDQVRVSGKLYSGYGSKIGKISFAQLQPVDRHLSRLDMWRFRFSAGLRNYIPEPQSSLALGILVGERQNIGEEVNQNLTNLGLSHIIAVSGYNLTIIIFAVQTLLANRSKFQSTMISLSLIATFLLITGFSASVTRAALVSILTIWAGYFGRSWRPILLISLTAAITALFNPYDLWFDVGWHLSYLAFFGILIIAPRLLIIFSKPKTKSAIKQVVIDSMAAIIMTAPYILYRFQIFSSWSLLANFIILPFIPLVMLTAFIAGLTSVIVPSLAVIWGTIANLVLTYIVDMSQLLTNLPKLYFERSLTSNSLLYIYFCILAMIWLLGHKLRRHVKITDETKVRSS